MDITSQLKAAEDVTLEDVTLARTMDDMNDVRRFLSDCVGFLGSGFHPDNSGADYLDRRDRYLTFTDRQVAAFDALMSRAFHVCEVAGEDLYAVVIELAAW